MSRRALRRLRGEQKGQQPLVPLDLPVGEPEEGDEEEPLGSEAPVEALAGSSRRQKKKNQRSQDLLPQRGINNLYELIKDVDAENTEVSDLVTEHDVRDPKLNLLDSKQSNGSTENGEVGKKVFEDELSNCANDEQLNCANKHRKKKKRKKNKKNPAGDVQEEAESENIDRLLEKITNGLVCQTECTFNSDSRPLLYVEHRNLNPETELKRYFGARAVLGEQRPRQRQRQSLRSIWLTAVRENWPRYSKTGLSMRLLETKSGIQYFTFEHNRDYQQVQFKFLEAVDSMDPHNIVVLLQMNPYHIDSLLQLSDLCRIQEDQEMSRDLIERALYSFECAFHPVFSLTSGSCRLNYRRPENRGFFLALYRHMWFLEKRGCPRTALEFCKLVMSLDPDYDPLCMLLLIDFLSLRAREYAFLLRMFEEWETHKNLSQLPNFAFSVPLACFLLCQQEDLPVTEQEQLRSKADHMIQTALIMFPSVLMPLLDCCGVQPDPSVSSHPFWALQVQISQPPALGQLISLYVERTHTLWKDVAVMSWLENNVKAVIRRLADNDPLVEESKRSRRLRYQSAPRNIHRHIILSEIQEAIAALPLEVTLQPLMGFDPLPPLDSVVSYTRPERRSTESRENTLSLFLRSLLPNFQSLQAAPLPRLEEEEAAAGDDALGGARRELNQGVNRLMAAMRDMLANIQFQEPPREDNPDEDEEEWD
ncbi:transcription factor 25 [Protopterus annectens]|uniref:transcription factor 25 n=1 Tax=Protopterus annectens TaxID=7888 RepID=UPI001CFBB8A9|nr:transcription factor 25 [Protopterus annectens]